MFDGGVIQMKYPKAGDLKEPVTLP